MQSLMTNFIPLSCQQIQYETAGSSRHQPFFDYQPANATAPSDDPLHGVPV
jgi:hypothetical protein